jgi:hypothetical protein
MSLFHQYLKRNNPDEENDSESSEEFEDVSVPAINPRHQLPEYECQEIRPRLYLGPKESAMVIIELLYFLF